MRRSIMLIGYMSVLFCGGCSHVQYPPVKNLWNRLAQRQYVRGEKTWEFSSFHIIPSAYRKALRLYDPKEKSFGLKRLSESNAFFVEGVLEDSSAPFQPESEFERFYDGNSDEDFKERFGALRLTEKYKDYEAKIKRCERVLRSEVFWKEVLGNDFFNALAENCNKQENDPSASLYVEGYSYKLASYRCRGISVLNNECILDSLFRRVYIVSLSQFHKQAKTEALKGYGGIGEEKRWVDKEANEKRTVTDFEIHLKLTVNMDAEEIEEVVLYDCFVVDKLICFLPGGRVLFDKRWENE